MEAAALVLRQRDGGGLLHVHQQPLEADQALARLRDQLAVEADALDHAAQVAAARRAAAVAARKDACRDTESRSLPHALEQVGDALDECLEQAGEQRRRGRCRRPAMLSTYGDELPERRRFERSGS